MRSQHLGLTTLLAASALSCGDEHDTYKPVLYSDATCEALSSCDIADKDCRQKLLEATACERRMPSPSMPPVRNISRSALRDELRSELDLEGEASFSLADRGLAALHMLSASQAPSEAALDAYVSGLAAYYDEETRTITVVEDQSESEPDHMPLTRMYILAHELTHYLQDTSVGLAALADGANTIDASVSTRSLTEGEADATAWRVASRIAGSGPAQVRWSQLYEEQLSSALSAMDSSASPLVTGLLSMPYAVGLEYVSEVWNEYGRDHVDKLFTSAPTRLVDWLSGYGEGRVAPTRSQALECDPTLQEEGLEVQSATRLGSLGVLAQLAAAGTPDLALATAMVGDLVVVYAEPAADARPTEEIRFRAVWRTRWASATSAQQFVDASRFPDVYVRRDGLEVTQIAGGDVAAIAATQRAGTCEKIDWASVSTASKAGSANGVLRLPRAF